jgi:ribosomal protein S18 acetylase RimI-like enzyme
VAIADIAPTPLVAATSALPPALRYPHPMPTLRPTTPADAAFLRQMTYEAIHWRDGERPSIDDTFATPALAIIIDAWGRPGDSGLVAIADDGEPIGAAWYRTFTADHHAYGFVDEAIPEISIGLARGARDRGLGTLLLTALLAHARDARLTQLSLAVEQANARAHHIYAKLGFRIVRSSPEDHVMLIDL